MNHVFSVSLFLHLLAFAAFAGSAVISARLLRRSSEAGTAPPARDALEEAAAGLITKTQLPAIFLSVISGAGLVIAKPAFLQNPAMHAKLTVVFVLLVVSHLEMFNARRIVRARAAGDDAAIAARKKRHGLFAAIDLIGIATILALVAFALLG